MRNVPGQVRFSLVARSQVFDDLYSSTKREGDPNDHRGTRYDFIADVQYQISEHVRINLSVPYVDAKMRAHKGLRDSDAGGLGDVRATVTLSLWHPDVDELVTHDCKGDECEQEGCKTPSDLDDDFERELLDLANLDFLVGIKLPTGDETNRDLVSDSRFAQAGDGTTRILLGARYATDLPLRFSVYSSVLFTIALSETNYDARPGHETFMNLGFAYNGLRDLIGVTLFVSLDYVNTRSWHGSSFAGGSGSTGSNTLFISPGISLRWPKSLHIPDWMKKFAVEFLAEIPVWRRVHGLQLVGDAAYTLGVSFTM